MNIRESQTVKTSQFTTEQRVVKNDCYMLDEQGKEVPITTSMVQDVCIELLRKCRTAES
ncbi:MAG: hypothetical protein QM666_09790 [Acinetobacter sp.]